MINIFLVDHINRTVSDRSSKTFKMIIWIETSIKTDNNMCVDEKTPATTVNLTLETLIPFISLTNMTQHSFTVVRDEDDKDIYNVYGLMIIKDKNIEPSDIDMSITSLKSDILTDKITYYDLKNSDNTSIVHKMRSIMYQSTMIFTNDVTATMATLFSCNQYMESKSCHNNNLPQKIIELAPVGEFCDKIRDHRQSFHVKTQDNDISEIFKMREKHNNTTLANNLVSYCDILYNKIVDMTDSLKVSGKSSEITEPDRVLANKMGLTSLLEKTYSTLEISKYRFIKQHDL